MKPGHSRVKSMAVSLVALFLAAGLTTPATAQKAIELSNEQAENIVRRSYPYVAMYNVNNKFALDTSSPMNSGGWNKTFANTTLADHTLQSIARPNNDTLYLTAMIDVRQEPMILEFPSFDSKYVSLMVTAYDHYVNIPMSTTRGDFDKPSRILFYSQRTQGYRGDPVRGVDRVMDRRFRVGGGTRDAPRQRAGPPPAQPHDHARDTSADSVGLPGPECR